MTSKYKQLNSFNKIARRNYSKIYHDFEMPNLIEMQINAFNKFREKEIRTQIENYFPISSPNGKFKIEFERIWLEEPRKTIAECKYEGRSYESGIYVALSITDNETGEKKSAKKSSKKGEGIFFGNIPIMTPKGTFVINGIEKVVIAQIVRSSGIYVLPKSSLKLNNSRKKQLRGNVAEFLAIRGLQMMINIPENRDVLNVAIKDSSGESARTFSATTLLKAIGLHADALRKLFNHNPIIEQTLKEDEFSPENIFKDAEISSLIGSNASSENDTSIDGHLRRTTSAFSRTLKGELPFYDEMTPKQKELIDEIISEKAAKTLIHELAISTRMLEIESLVGSSNSSYQNILWNHLFNPRKYEMGDAGRYKLNRKLRLSERLYQRVLAEDILNAAGQVVIKRDTMIQKEHIDLIKKLSQSGELNTLRELQVANFNTPKNKKMNTNLNYESVNVYSNNEDKSEIFPIIANDAMDESTTLSIPDIVSAVSYVIGLRHDIGSFDDIDHLGNKRIKLINELLKMQTSGGLAKVEKYIKDKLSIIDSTNKQIGNLGEEEEPMTIKTVINTKPLQQALKDFFNSHQLTQFLDQENPLSEITNKRRISAMGPGGISRDDPNLDVRDVHYSHYGRICPIETPEGMNIGLIMALATYAKVDERGFILTPYMPVKNGKIINGEPKWLTALQEEDFIIAEANSRANEDGTFMEPRVICRYRSQTNLYPVESADLIDVSPKQVVSLAASAIPFLEHDDANRALMGANMQRQAVPLIKPQMPYVGTGIESRIAYDSGLAVISPVDGVIQAVDSGQIKIKSSEGSQTIDLTKFNKSNQDTTINQSPLVKVGQQVKKGELLADGPAMQYGELALGQNVLVAFTTWSGYNYEDAIILSDRLVKDDTFSSIHISEHVLKCTKTKVGDEEITRELPNVGEDSKRYLDENGVIMVGAEVKAGDILVGKITPKGQVDVTAEEKLLQAIFGEKTKNVKESSLRVPNGGDGTVAAIRRFKLSEGHDLENDVIELVKVYIAQKRKIQIGDKMSGRHGNKGVISKVVPIEDMPYLEDGTPIDVILNPQGVPSRMNIGQVLEVHLGWAALQLGKRTLLTLIDENASAEKIHLELGIKPDNVHDFSEAVRPLIQRARKIDQKNWIDHVSNLELEAVARTYNFTLYEIGVRFASPVFDGVNHDDLNSVLKEAGTDAEKTKCKFPLVDGRTGEKFDQLITVGVMYFLKLGHMVDDKIHSRAIGPYSKITQQPLGGKSQNGGQRFGEMEVWALEGYGAAHTLREILTIKSDDVRGRNSTYAAIVKGQPIPEPGLPESFKLLTKELQGLGLNVSLLDEQGTEKDYSKSLDIYSEDEVQSDLGIENLAPISAFAADEADENF